MEAAAGSDATTGSVWPRSAARRTGGSLAVRGDDLVVALLVVLMTLTLAGFGVLCAHCVRDSLVAIDGPVAGSAPLLVPVGG
jgi:hypothetical protein